jgi:hypothetical protein
MRNSYLMVQLKPQPAALTVAAAKPAASTAATATASSFDLSQAISSFDCRHSHTQQLRPSTTCSQGIYISASTRCSYYFAVSYA